MEGRDKGQMKGRGAWGGGGGFQVREWGGKLYHCFGTRVSVGGISTGSSEV